MREWGRVGREGRGWSNFPEGIRVVQWDGRVGESNEINEIKW